MCRSFSFMKVNHILNVIVSTIELQTFLFKIHVISHLQPGCKFHDTAQFFASFQCYCYTYLP